VKEAFRLLNKSIIRVEQPDIHFEEEEQLLDERPAVAADDQMETDAAVPDASAAVQPEEAEAALAAAAAATADTAAAKGKGLKLSYDEYRQLANLLVMRLRQLEEEAVEGE
jgi:DNA replication licensing factor MCM6